METPSQMDTLSQTGDDGPSSDDWIPRVGMEFDNTDEAWKFWRTYASKTGFGVRQRYANKARDGSITSTRYCCAKEGVRPTEKKLKELVKKPRAETRTNCPVRMGLVLVRESGKYRVHEFESTHCHELHDVECSHMLRSHREITEVQGQAITLADDVGLTQRQQHDFSTALVGGKENVGYMRIDLKNYLRNRRERDMEFGEAGYLMRYFETRSLVDTQFFHSVQFDNNEQITNIFWADNRMKIDYALFGDVVTFDTTFSTNKEYRPLGVFLGFNHHRQLVIFGAALLYDETADSFGWLFQTFLEAHKCKKPVTIFTDQDAAMAKALGEVIPDTRHGLCTWHLMQNAIKNVGHLMKDGSNLLTDLKKLMYEYVEVEEFERAWGLLLSTYEASENSWLNNLYRLKEKWARCYMKSTVTLGMRSTQLSESLNGDLKDYLKCKLNLNGFFKRFDKVVNDKRYKELQAEFDAREKLPTIAVKTSYMLQQAGKVYTPTVFDKFQSEWMKREAMVLKERNETGPLREYLVGSFGVSDRLYKVTGNPSDEVVNCACNHFETVGFLCCHALKVLDVMDIKLIPNAYILKRWTREARDGIIEKNGLEAQGNGDMDATTERYREVCPELLKLGAKSSHTAKRHEFLKNLILTANKSLDEMPLVEDVNPKCQKAGDVSAKCPVLKKKDGHKGGKRHKSCLEKNKTKRKKQGERSKVIVPQPSSQASACNVGGEFSEVVGLPPMPAHYTPRDSASHGNLEVSTDVIPIMPQPRANEG